MLRLTLELVPFGVEAEKHTLGVLEIINDGTGTSQRGNYNAIIRRPDWATDNGPKVPKRVVNWARARPVWELVAACLEAYGYDGGKTDHRKNGI